MRAKQKNAPKNKTLLIPLHPPNPFYIVGGAPSSLAGPARAGLANVHLFLVSSSVSSVEFFLLGWQLAAGRALRTPSGEDAGFPHASKTRAGEPPPSLSYPCPAFVRLARPLIGSASRKDIICAPCAPTSVGG